LRDNEATYRFRGGRSDASGASQALPSDGIDIFMALAKNKGILNDSLASWSVHAVKTPANAALQGIDCQAPKHVNDPSCLSVAVLKLGQRLGSKTPAEFGKATANELYRINLGQAIDQGVNRQYWVDIANVNTAVATLAG